MKEILKDSKENFVESIIYTPRLSGEMCPVVCVL